MKAWLIDALLTGSVWALAQASIRGFDEIRWALVIGYAFGIALASLVAWQGWPSLGRSYFVNRSEG
jgi:hypothetical protein